MVTQRDYEGPDDLEFLQALARRIWSPARRFHIGDIAWGSYSIPGAEAAFRVSLWEDSGVLLAWAWVELPGHLELLVDPDAVDLLPEIISWFEDTASGPDRSCLVMEGDTYERAALRRCGYEPRDHGPFFRRHHHDLTDIPPVALPEGFTITQVAAGEAERRAAAHRAGWSDFGSRVTGDSYRHVMGAYPYRPETDLVVVSPAGDWVASALGWYDEINHVGLVEPVSCAPSFRGMGLAKAVNIALLHTFGALGAASSVILPRGDEAYPAPARLYRSIGYQPGPRTRCYVHRLTDGA